MDTDSEDLRQRVVQACDDGILTREEIAEPFRVSTAWIRWLLQRQRETGSFSALPGGRGLQPKLTEAHRSRLSRLVEKHPDATRSELKRRARLSCSISTIYRALKSLGFRLKKSHSGRANKIVQASGKQGSHGLIA